MEIVVGSRNREKIRGVSFAFARMFPEERQIDVFRKGPKSGVACQPIGIKETLMGSTNRALNAFELYQSADYAVGIESGLMLDKTGTRYQLVDYATVINSDRIQKSACWLGEVFSEEITSLIQDGVSLRQAIIAVDTQGKVNLDAHIRIRIQRTQQVVQKVLREFRSQIRVR